MKTVDKPAENNAVKKSKLLVSAYHKQWKYYCQ